jgi:hypothetical protein
MSDNNKNKNQRIVYLSGFNNFALGYHASCQMFSLVQFLL